MAPGTWGYWISSETSVITCAVGTDSIWLNWTATSTGTLSPWADATTAGHEYVYKKTRAAMRREREEAQRKQYEEEITRRKAKAAEAKAEQLLVALLSLSQRAELEKDRTFTVIGGKTKRRYRVAAGQTHGNVKEVDENGKIVASLCCQPENVPTWDANLAQKLMLERCEDEFLRIANRRAV